MMTTVECGWSEHFGAPTHALTYFWLMRVLLRLLASGNTAVRLREALIEQGAISEQFITHLPRAKEIEVFTPAHRRTLLSMVWHLTKNWPDRFVDLCEAAGVRPSHLAKEEARVPFMFVRDVVHRLGDQSAACMEDRAFVAPLSETAPSPNESEAEVVQGQWGNGGYWKLAGIDPATKSAARKMAQARGLHVSDFVEELIQRELASRRI